jgi:tyrosine-protein kinase Etk/Wzc
MAKPHLNDGRIQSASISPGPSQGAPHGPAPDEGVDLSQVGATLREGLPLILRIAGSVFAVVMGFTCLSHMDFSSSGRLYLGELDAKAASKRDGELDLSGGSQHDVGSEIEILKSRSQVASAIMQSGLNVSLSRPGWAPPRFVSWRLSGRDPALLDGGASEVAAINTTIPTQSRGEREFKVRFRSATDYELWSEDSLLGKGRLGETVALPAISLTLIPGAKGVPAKGADYTLVVFPLDQVVDEALAALTVTMPRANGTEPPKVLTLDFVHNSPQLAAAFLRELMNGYLDERQKWKTEDATAAEVFVTDQLKSVREALDNTQKKLADYRSNTRVVVLDSEAKAMIEQIGRVEEQRVAARLRVAALADMRRALKNPQSRLEAFMQGEGDDHVLTELATSLSKARQELTDLEQRFNPEAPDVQQQRAQVGAQIEMVKNYIESRLERAQDNLGALNGVIGQFENKLKTVPGAELGLAQIARESEVYSRMYSYLLERQQQTAIVKASTVSKNRILDMPRIAYREDSPKLGTRMASLVFGLLLGVIVVLSRRFLSSTLQSEREVHAVGRDLNVLAYIPREPRSEASATDKGGLLNIDARAPFTEAFRTLRANLYLASDPSRGNVVLLTSPVPGDGKTTTTIFLAAVLAADGKQVLVIDADLRKPSHDQLLHHTNELGLRGVLSGQCNWRDAVQPVVSAFGEFYSIGAGKLAPAELLSGERMTRFIAETRARFDYVLIDAASFPLVADALVLAREADCVLSVLRLQHTPRKITSEHTQRLFESSGSYGIVINDAHVVSRQRYGGAYPAETPLPPRPLLSARGIAQRCKVMLAGGPARFDARQKRNAGRDG